MRLPFAQDGEHLFPRSESGGVEGSIRYGTAVVREITRTLVARSDSTCKPGNNSPVCAKPESSTNNTTLPIVLGAVIPITCAIVVFVYLHRRNKKKQAIEDANDPHKSLDFGTEFPGRPPAAKSKRGLMGARRGGDIPEMTITSLGPDPMRPGRAMRGLSMDLMNSPYLLPAALHGSRESLHSMSRSMHDEHDPYRPVTFMRNSGETTRSPRPFNENASMYSASTVQTGNDKSSLMANAQSMSHSLPKRGDSATSPSDDYAMRELHSSNRNAAPGRKGSQGSSPPVLPEISELSPPRRKSTKDLPPLPPPPAEAEGEPLPPPRSSSRPPRKASLAAATLPPINVRSSDASFYEDELPPPPPPPKMFEPEPEPEPEPGPEPEPMDDYDDVAQLYAGRFSIDNSAPSQQYPIQAVNNNRVSVMGLRPLPPNLPEEHPEKRADRIRSFYKEYFDDSRPNPANAFYEDYDPAYLDAAIYDPDTGDYIYPQAPFAQPMGRRAMTPPPRGASQFSGPDHSRHYSTMSGGRGPYRGHPAHRGPPKKKLPPPKALTSLPTPHMLRDDTALIMNPIDFAPPTSFRETQNGRRPDSPMGIQRPYSPAVKAYSPLVPAFDELSVMPSPHALRKSGTYSALDFAVLPRFRGHDGGTASDAGSIRSARSGISAMQVNAVRAGAYRVSRIPKEFVTSREDLTTQLRPKMDMISRA